MRRLIDGAKRLGIDLSPEQIAAFETHSREMLSWNQRMNLTAIVDPEDVETRHFLDSLTVVLALQGRLADGARVLDVGAGAGFPGLPLRVLYPRIRVTLLEAVGKKATFLEHLVRGMGLSGVEVIWKRAEDLAREPAHRERYDVALARAVAPMPALAELTLPFCRVGGRVVAQKKGDIGQEMEAAGHAIRVLGGRAPELLPVMVPELGDDHRFLVVIDKARPTPTAYPRRAGAPRKYPLSAPARRP